LLADLVHKVFLHTAAYTASKETYSEFYNWRKRDSAGFLYWQRNHWI